MNLLLHEATELGIESVSYHPVPIFDSIECPLSSLQISVYLFIFITFAKIMLCTV